MCVCVYIYIYIYVYIVFLFLLYFLNFYTQPDDGVLRAKHIHVLCSLLLHNTRIIVIDGDFLIS
jgi:hypothetical protein